MSTPESEWPIKSVKDVAVEARENIIRLQKKAFVAALTRAGAKKELSQDLAQIPTDLHRPPGKNIVVNLVDVKRFSSLSGLMRTLGLVWSAAKKFLRAKAMGGLNWEAVQSTGVVTVTEGEDTFRDLCLAV